MHFLALFHTAIPIQPPPLQGTSFLWKEGMFTRAPSLGRGCRAQRGGIGFLFGRRSRLLFAFPIGKGVVLRKAVDRVLSYNDALETISPLSFIPLSPSNLRPFGAPPSRGRRECPREPLPLEGAAERSEAGLASFWGGKAASSLPSPRVEGFAGETVFTFLHPSHAKTTVSYERSFLCVLLA